MPILCQNSGSMFGKWANLYKVCTIELRKSKLRKKQKKTQHSRLYATFSIFLLFYLRIIGVNWQWTLTLCGMKLKPGPVLVLVKWSWLVILSTWSRDFVSERFLAGKLHTSFVEGARFSFTSCIENEITAGVGRGLAHCPYPLRTIYITRP